MAAPTVGNDVPTAGDTLGALSSDIVSGVFSLGAGSSADIAVSAAGVVTATTAFGDNRAYTLNAVVTAPAAPSARHHDPDRLGGGRHFRRQRLRRGRPCPGRRRHGEHGRRRQLRLWPEWQ